jgi:DNA mismatch repair protein MutS2
MAAKESFDLWLAFSPYIHANPVSACCLGNRNNHVYCWGNHLILIFENQWLINEPEMEKKGSSRHHTDHPKVGDLVRLRNSQSTGIIKAINEGEAVVIMGGLRVKTEFKNLKVVNDARKIQKASFRKVHIQYERKFIEPRLDIHGMRAEEAIKQVTRYLDDLLISNRNEVEIMHGKGTGVLKQVVHDLLDERDEVKSYRLAPPARGGAGCTIVRL